MALITPISRIVKGQKVKMTAALKFQIVTLDCSLAWIFEVLY